MSSSALLARDLAERRIFGQFVHRMRDVLAFALQIVGDGVALLPAASRKEDPKVLEDHATRIIAALKT